MKLGKRSRTATGSTRSAILVAGVSVLALFLVALGFQSSIASPLSAAHDSRAGSETGHRQSAGGGRSPSATPFGPGQDIAGEADGVVPDGVTVFDDRYRAVSELDPDLLRAVRRAATDAADAGVTFLVNSGWRSRAYQDELLRDAVSRYGSESEAARWVATADTSPHVSGDAIDIGHRDAAAWLSEHGAGYGLCQIYRNEPWHFELRPDAVDDGCPTPYADPTQDPRMQG